MLVHIRNTFIRTSSLLGCFFFVSLYCVAVAGTGFWGGGEVGEKDTSVRYIFVYSIDSN